jgi:hypothetical protein
MQGLESLARHGRTVPAGPDAAAAGPGAADAGEIVGAADAGEIVGAADAGGIVDAARAVGEPSAVYDADAADDHSAPPAE